MTESGGTLLCRRRKVYIAGQTKIKNGNPGSGGGKRSAGRYLMRVRMRAITVVFAIAMSAWLSIEAHAGGQGGSGAQSTASTISGEARGWEKAADIVCDAPPGGQMGND